MIAGELFRGPSRTGRLRQRRPPVRGIQEWSTRCSSWSIAVIAIMITSGGPNPRLRYTHRDAVAVHACPLADDPRDRHRVCLWLRPTFTPRLPPFARCSDSSLSRAPPVRCSCHPSCSRYGTTWQTVVCCTARPSGAAARREWTFWRCSPRTRIMRCSADRGVNGSPNRPNGYAENVASLTIVGVAVIAIAVWRYRFRPPRVWVGLTRFFALLALGPVRLGRRDQHIRAGPMGPSALSPDHHGDTDALPVRRAVDDALFVAVCVGACPHHGTSPGASPRGARCNRSCLGVRVDAVSAAPVFRACS